MRKPGSTWRRRTDWTDLEIDTEGNVTGIRRGIGNGPLICVAAHLDTVFPAGTDVKVRREGTKLFAPGIGDDTRSLAVLLAWKRAMDAAGIENQGRHSPFACRDVGEEGAGDLRGMRYLFTQGRYKDRISAFLTVDSPEMDRIVTGGVGSKRYRVTFHAPGGHSYGAFGVVNPIFAMADAISRLGRVPVPTEPKTTYSASVTGGGTSINSIPNAVWTEFDLRSEAISELTALDERFLQIIDAAVAAENDIRSTRNGRVTAEILPIGNRPAGHTSESHELVQFAPDGRSTRRGHDTRVRGVVDRCQHSHESWHSGNQIGSGGTGAREAFAGRMDRRRPPDASLRGMEAGPRDIACGRRHRVTLVCRSQTRSSRP